MTLSLIGGVQGILRRFSHRCPHYWVVTDGVGVESLRPDSVTADLVGDALGPGRSCSPAKRESVRRWLTQAEVDDGTRPGVTSEEPAEVKRLKAENMRLREDNEILRRGSTFFAGSSTPESV